MTKASSQISYHSTMRLKSNNRLINPDLMIDMSRVKKHKLRHQDSDDLKSDRVTHGSMDRREERVLVKQKIRQDMMMTRNNRLSHSQTPRHIPLQGRISKIGRASSVLSAVSSASHVSLRSIIKTRARQSDITVTS